MRPFDFQNLFILDLANNHQGDVEHGLSIIRAVGEVAREAGVRAALKFQFRHLETFIHPDAVGKADVKHVPRFFETSLTRKEHDLLAAEVRNQGMVTMATPFDEASLTMLLDMDIDVIKVASCSANDWPLLQEISGAGRPVVASTGGVTTEEIDRLVQVLQSGRGDLALMHCVALYPTPNEELKLNQIDILRSRYPGVPVGWSTHEDPDDVITVRVAYAKGARLFERHVGLPTDKYEINAYSATPQQVERWLEAHRAAVAMCGGENRSPASIAESDSLRSLCRGVFVRDSLEAGQTIAREDVYFAMPAPEHALTTAEWQEGMKADRAYAPNEALAMHLADTEPTADQIINDVLLQVRGMLNAARVPIGRQSSVEISHHYGLHRFREFGAVLINVINREYCKKLIVQLPRQKHPYHHHRQKEESFQVLYGDLEIEKEGRSCVLGPGDVYLVEPGRWHKFQTAEGVVFEEVSTTHRANDSFYMDKRIARLSLDDRKTYIPNWEAG